jgi:hypothetical protein
MGGARALLDRWTVPWHCRAVGENRSLPFLMTNFFFYDPRRLSIVPTVSTKRFARKFAKSLDAAEARDNSGC